MIALYPLALISVQKMHKTAERTQIGSFSMQCKKLRVCFNKDTSVATKVFWSNCLLILYLLPTTTIQYFTLLLPYVYSLSSVCGNIIFKKAAHPN